MTALPPKGVPLAVVVTVPDRAGGPDVTFSATGRRVNRTLLVRVSAGWLATLGLGHLPDGLVAFTRKRSHPGAWRLTGTPRWDAPRVEDSAVSVA